MFNSDKIPLYVIPLFQVRLVETSSVSLLLSSTQNYRLIFPTYTKMKDWRSKLEKGVERASEFEMTVNLNETLWTPKQIEVLQLTEINEIIEEEVESVFERIFIRNL